jgi:ribosomal protein S18 acetylase RimI-like enzyme
MELRLQFDTININWELVVIILKEANMANYTSEIHKTAFNNSHTVVFAFDGEKLIGFGRAISDGICQAALYDIVVISAYQGKGIGKIIVNSILEKLPNCNFILYASPGKENFYKKLNFSKMITGMALFANAERMRLKGFTE